VNRQRPVGNRWWPVVTGALWLALAAGFVRAQPVPVTPDLLRPPDENRYVDRAVPDVLLLRPAEPSVRLSSLWEQRPVLFTFVFTRCAGICSPLLHSLKAATTKVGGAGTDYQIVVASFDARDGPDTMAAMAHDLGLEKTPGWTFAALSAADVQQLAPAIGFWYRWDEASQQFNHPAMVVAVDHGRTARLLVGGEVSPVRLQEVLDQLHGKLVSIYPLPGKVAFRCFEYNADGRLRLHWGILLMLLPSLAAGALTVLIFQRRGRRD
jgi:cytochrome oxidase Cu insertion factor (SCO1/SenC/PrrC family)